MFISFGYRNKFMLLAMLLIALMGMFATHMLNAAPNFGITILSDGSVQLTVEDPLPEFDDGFGTPVAIDGDTAVVAASRDLDNTGAAYVFIRDANGDWFRQTKLVANDGVQRDYFGEAVAISGNTVFIGVPDEYNSGNAGGSVYVFERDQNNNWTQTQKLNAADASLNNDFGVSIALEGDTAAIGARYADTNENISDQAGAVYIFTRDMNGIWSQTQRLRGNDTSANDWLGFSVALDGDTLVAGAYRKTEQAGNSVGAAYVFTRDENNDWSQQAKLNFTNPEANDAFGFSVALDGDIAVVGAALDYRARQSAFVFERKNGIWTQKAELKGVGRFGRSVAVDNGTIFVSERLGDALLYIYTLDIEGEWSLKEKLFPLVSSDTYTSAAIDTDKLVLGTDKDVAFIYTRDENGNWTDVDAPPVAVCQDITVKINLADDDVTITAAQIDNGSNDADGIASLAIDIDTFTAAQLGTTVPVTLTVTDTSSNTSTCTGDVFVTSALDANGDGIISPSDATYVMNRLTTSDVDADVDGNGTVEEADLQLVIDALGTTVGQE